ncbi:phytanoyl-CoA dioxygenase family protein [Microcoleus sp.]|uniref:phytanoyl-CoA dioxygenase family protein n=1 Tax=Microcoleus sp. TaxID=44472 RepID=UPI0035935B63
MISLDKLSNSNLQLLDQMGFVHLEDILLSESLLELHRELSLVFDQMKQTSFSTTQQLFWQRVPSQQIETLRLPSIENLFGEQEAFLSIKSSITKVIRDVFDPDMDLRSVHAFFKPAKNGGETPWHQDPAYGDISIVHDNITCWIPLQDILSELESCLEFLPGSHLGKELRRHDPLAKGRLSALVADITNDEFSNRATIPCKLGDIILHRSYVIHRGTPNRSDKDRIAVVFIYGKP